ncbi:MAG: hypothetical protein K8U57_20565 [Planctomycetes bacterium]|nr:hypothetical protein [Planctomycetota bacterium]
MGKRRSTPGTGQLSIEMGAELLAKLKEYAKGRGESLRQVVERSVWRDMSNPPDPPPPLPPLPPFPPVTSPASEEPEPKKTVPKGKPKKGG